VSRYCAVVLSAFLLLVAASCGGGDDNSGANGADRTNETEDTDGASVTPAENGVEPTLEGLSAAYLAGVDGKVTYRYISNFGQHPDGFWTDYHLDGMTLTRQDWRKEPNDLAIETYAIVNGEEGYVCSTTVTTVDCSFATIEEVRNTFPHFIPVTQVPDAILDGIDGLQAEPLPDETVAGLKAICFELNIPGRIRDETPPGTEKVNICFAENGALLLMSRTVTFTDPALPVAQLDLEATEVADTSPSDFEPPASPSG
jgi:hypothetical protein